MAVRDNLSEQWWLWPSALSLEPPAVALAWQDLLARSHDLALRPEGRLALGLTVWAVYLADRLIDTQLHSPGRERLIHQFCRAHRRFVMLLLALIVAADFLLAIFWLRPQILVDGLWVSFGVSVYLTLFVWRRWQDRAKPLAAAALFTAGVFLVAWTRTPSPADSLTPQAFVFFALCLGNLTLSRSATLVGFAMAILAVSCLLHSGTGWYRATAAGAAGLAALAAWGRGVSPELRALLADVALLAPALRLWTPIG